MKQMMFEDLRRGNIIKRDNALWKIISKDEDILYVQKVLPRNHNDRYQNWISKDESLRFVLVDKDDIKLITLAT
jgi:predicted O-methyltransferase YrrM